MFGRVSPDGKLVVAADMKTTQWALYPVSGAGGEPRPVPNIRPGESVAGFDEKGESLYLVSRGLTYHVDRLELATGKRSPLREITAGRSHRRGDDLRLPAHAGRKSYCYSFMRALSRLYVIDGLR